jgi:hypothetical protein
LRGKSFRARCYLISLPFLCLIHFMLYVKCLGHSYSFPCPPQLFFLSLLGEFVPWCCLLIGCWSFLVPSFPLPYGCFNNNFFLYMVRAMFFKKIPWRRIRWLASLTRVKIYRDSPNFFPNVSKVTDFKGQSKSDNISLKKKKHFHSSLANFL